MPEKWAFSHSFNSWLDYGLVIDHHQLRPDSCPYYTSIRDFPVAMPLDFMDLLEQPVLNAVQWYDPLSPPLPHCRCCPASFKSRGWSSSHQTGLDSLWLQRVCCCTCRSVRGERLCLLYTYNLFFTMVVNLILPSSCDVFQPLSWQQPYVPVLARGMLDFLMAPTAFLMGCHISHFEEVAAVSAPVSLSNFV